MGSMMTSRIVAAAVLLALSGCGNEDGGNDVFAAERTACVDRINAFRATENLPHLAAGRTQRGAPMSRQTWMQMVGAPTAISECVMSARRTPALAGRQPTRSSKVVCKQCRMRGRANPSRNMATT